MKLTCVIASFAGLLSLATAGISPKRDATWNTSVTILHASGSAVGENPSLGAPASHGFNVTLVGDNYFPWGSEIHCSGHPFADSTFIFPIPFRALRFMPRDSLDPSLVS